MRIRPVAQGSALTVLLAWACTLPPTPPREDGAAGSGTSGTPATGGASTGGASTGGDSTGGTSTGGDSTGGTAGTATTGGTTSTGGSSGDSSGGSSGTQGGGGTGGSATDGAGMGGRGGTSMGGSGVAGGGAGGTDAGGRGAGGAGTGGSGVAGGGAPGGTAGGGAIVELARGRTATADSEENNTTSNPPKVNLAGSGNDGSATTRWCAANAGSHYWQVDLAASHSLSRIEIDFEYPTQAMGFSYGYTVGVSNDGAAFTTAIDQTANTSITTTQTAMFPAATAGRYVRITVFPPTTTSATWSSFWEARIYGQ